MWSFFILLLSSSYNIAGETESKLERLFAHDCNLPANAEPCGFSLRLAICLMTKKMQHSGCLFLPEEHVWKKDTSHMPDTKPRFILNFNLFFTLHFVKPEKR